MMNFSPLALNITTVKIPGTVSLMDVVFPFRSRQSGGLQHASVFRPAWNPIAWGEIRPAAECGAEVSQREGEGLLDHAVQRGEGCTYVLFSIFSFYSNDFTVSFYFFTTWWLNMKRIMSGFTLDPYSSPFLCLLQCTVSALRTALLRWVSLQGSGRPWSLVCCSSLASLA